MCCYHFGVESMPLVAARLKKDESEPFLWSSLAFSSHLSYAKVVSYCYSRHHWSTTCWSRCHFDARHLFHSLRLHSWRTIADRLSFSAVRNQRTRNRSNACHSEWYHFRRHVDRNRCPSPSWAKDPPVWCQHLASMRPASNLIDSECFSVAQSVQNACPTFQSAIDRRYLVMKHQYLQRTITSSYRKIVRQCWLARAYPNPVYCCHWYWPYAHRCHSPVAATPVCRAIHGAIECDRSPIWPHAPSNPLSADDRRPTDSPAIYFAIAISTLRAFCHSRSCIV